MDILEQEWQREYSLIKDLLTLQQVESGELDYSPQELELDRTITALSQSFIAKWQSDRDIDLTCTISPRDLKNLYRCRKFKAYSARTPHQRRKIRPMPILLLS